MSVEILLMSCTSAWPSRMYTHTHAVRCFFEGFCSALHCVALRCIIHIRGARIDEHMHIDDCTVTVNSMHAAGVSCEDLKRW